jgi:hypothetical protein
MIKRLVITRTKNKYIKSSGEYKTKSEKLSPDDKKIGTELALQGVSIITKEIGINVEAWECEVKFSEAPTIDILYWKHNHNYGISLYDVLYKTCNSTLVIYNYKPQLTQLLDNP